MDAYKLIEAKASEMLKKGELRKLELFLSALPQKNKRLVILDNLITVFYEEVKQESAATVFDYSLDLDKLVNHYMTVKLLLRRFEYDFPEKYRNELYDYCIDTGVSVQFLNHLINRNIFNPQDVVNKVEELFKRRMKEASYG